MAKRKQEKKQRFIQVIKCPACGAEIAFEWEAISRTVVNNSVTAKEG